jgi:hypothetical protein
MDTYKQRCLYIYEGMCSNIYVCVCVCVRVCVHARARLRQFLFKKSAKYTVSKQFSTYMCKH